MKEDRKKNTERIVKEIQEKIYKGTEEYESNQEEIPEVLKETITTSLIIKNLY